MVFKINIYKIINTLYFKPNNFKKMRICSCISSLLFITSSYININSVKSSKRHLSNIIKNPLSSSNIIKPKSENQKLYLSHLNNDKKKIIIVSGPAGTGKTMFACIEAIKQLKDEKIEKIVVTRPIISVEDEELGFLPGNVQKKMDPWTRPIFDIFQDYFTVQEINSLVQNNIIEISPLGFMRGRTFKNSFIIADEMQNSTPNQMLMLTTRMGEGSKMVITGDIQQKDAKFKSKCGLSDLIERIEKQNNYSEKDTLYEIVCMEKSDVQRSKIVSQILNLYDS